MPDKDILSDKTRISLLETVLPHYGFTLETCETDGTVTGYTYDTLCYLCENIVFPVKTAFMYAALTNCPSSTAGNTQRLSCPDFHSLCSAGTKMIYRLCLLHHL